MNDPLASSDMEQRLLSAHADWLGEEVQSLRAKVSGLNDQVVLLGVLLAATGLVVFAVILELQTLREPRGED